MNGTYQLADEDMMCMECDRDLLVGYPVGERLDGVTGDGIPIVELVCVYCAAGASE